MRSAVEYTAIAPHGGELIDRRVPEGERAERLRDAMARHDLGLGCDFCRWPMESGRADLAFARW